MKLLPAWMGSSTVWNWVWCILSSFLIETLMGEMMMMSWSLLLFLSMALPIGSSYNCARFGCCLFSLFCPPLSLLKKLVHFFSLNLSWQYITWCLLLTTSSEKDFVDEVSSTKYFWHLSFCCHSVLLICTWPLFSQFQALLWRDSSSLHPLSLLFSLFLPWSSFSSFGSFFQSALTAAVWRPHETEINFVMMGVGLYTSCHKYPVCFCTSSVPLTCPLLVGLG